MILADETRSPLAEYSDGKLAELVKEGNSEAFAELTARYMSLVRARALPLGGFADREDLCQEGLVGLLNAARTYHPGNGASFRTYAGVCITNRVLTACRSAAGRKNDPLRDFVSLSEEGSDYPALDGESDPAALFAEREGFRLMCRKIAEALTPLERKVLRLYLGGGSYGDIAKALSVSPKTADNALQRVRFKLRHRLGREGEGDSG